MEMDLDSAVQQVLKNASKARGIVSGLNQCVKMIEKHSAQLCFLADNCNEKPYKDLVPDNKKLGECAGQCKYTKEGKARKVVSASCIVVTNVGDNSLGLQYLVDKYRLPIEIKES